jgi:hypothetical protein
LKELLFSLQNWSRTQNYRLNSSHWRRWMYIRSYQLLTTAIKQFILHENGTCHHVQKRVEDDGSKHEGLLFWGVISCNLLGIWQRCEGIFLLCIQGRRKSMLKSETQYSSEIVVPLYQTKWRDLPRDRNLQNKDIWDVDVR